MTYKTNIHQQALYGMYNGIKQARDVVGRTMGTRGKNVVLEIDQYPFHEITNDGATIIEKMFFEDPLEKKGVDFLKEVVGRSNRNAGDGSSTTTLLVESIIKNGMSHNGIKVKKELDSLIPFIEQQIKNRTIKIDSSDFQRIKQVATTSSEDETLGELLAEIYGIIGSEGIIQPEYVLGKEGNSYNFIQGVRFANFCGYLSPAMVHDEEAIKENRTETRAVYENPMVLVTQKKITNTREIDPIVKLSAKEGRDLVIFTDDMDSQVAQALIATHQARKLGNINLPRITIVKAPTIWKDLVFEDFAKCTGSTIVHDASGVTFKNITSAHLGTCEKIIIGRDETVIIGPKDVSEHIAELKAVVESGNDMNDDAQRRIDWLTAKTVLLKVGGLSETELTYKRLKCEDAINATRSALTDGIVSGGGTILYTISQLMPDTIGGAILKEALQEPIRQIILNADVTVELSSIKESQGFNTESLQIEDMFESGIIDSSKITINACKNAIGIASTILTASDCITLPPKKEAPFPGIMMPQMPML